MNRTELSRAIAKLAAYYDCGKLQEAREWANIVRRMLDDAGL